MRIARGKQLRNRRGVSEVFGALMLILVVVIAVAAIAVFISQTEQQAQARQSFQNSVKNDNLQILHTTLLPSDPLIDYQIVNTTNSGLVSKYYIQYLNESSVNLFKAPYNANDIPLTCSLQGSGVRYSGNVSADVNVQLSTGSSCTFLIQGSLGNYVIKPATWDTIMLTIRNTNIQDSGVRSVAANDNYAHKWYELCTSNIAGCASASPGTLVAYTSGPPPLIIPAQATTNVVINYSDPENRNLAPLKNSSLKITLLSPSFNFFEADYLDPSAIAQINTVSEDYAVTNRDSIILDGSQTTFGSVASAQQFSWQIDTPVNATWSGTWADTKNIVTKYLTGKVVHYRPESLFNSTEIKSLKITGPLRITLKAVDSQGLTSRSNSAIVPFDPNLAPVGNLNLTSVSSATTSTTMVVQVLDIFGNPVKGAGVTFAITSGSNLTAIHGVSTLFNVTDSSGKTSTTIDWQPSSPNSADNAIIGVDTGKLPMSLIPVRFGINYP